MPPYEKVRLEMLRPNLYSLLTATVMLLFSSAPAAAQYGMAPDCPPPPHLPMQHRPLLQVPHSGYQAPIVDHYVQSAPKLWDDQQPIEHFLGEVARRSWLRFEYLHWQVRDPGNGNIGAPVTGIFSQNGQFEAFDNLNGGLSVGTAVIPNNSQISLNDVPGVRGTWGVNLNGGHAELNFFGTGNHDDTWTTGNIRNFRNPIAPEIGNEFSPNYILPLLNNGGISDVATLNGIVFDDRLDISMSTQIWGTELSLLTEAYLPGEGFQWQWLGGFRYLNVDEAYNLTGVYNAGGTVTDRVTRIHSNTGNHVYGPEIGGRASLVHRWMTFSVTPRIAFALNDNSATVSSDALGTGVFTTVRDSKVDFTTVTQVNFTGELHLTPSFSIFGGYEFMWMPRISRPHSNFTTDSTPAVGGGFDPIIGLDKRLQSYVVEGLSIGAVFRY